MNSGSDDKSIIYFIQIYLHSVNVGHVGHIVTTVAAYQVHQAENGEAISVRRGHGSNDFMPRLYYKMLIVM